MTERQKLLIEVLPKYNFRIAATYSKVYDKKKASAAPLASNLLRNPEFRFALMENLESLENLTAAQNVERWKLYSKLTGLEINSYAQ